MALFWNTLHNNISLCLFFYILFSLFSIYCLSHNVLYACTVHDWSALAVSHLITVVIICVAANIFTRLLQYVSSRALSNEDHLLT